MKDFKPAFIASSPNEGPTIASSIIRAGAGNLPDFKIFAKSFASFTVKFPVIDERPPQEAKEEPPKEVPTVKKKAPRKKPEKKKDVNMDELVQNLGEAKRLRAVVQAFMDAGISDADEIVAQCEQLRSMVPILSRMSDMSSRIKVSVEKWKKENSE